LEADPCNSAPPLRELVGAWVERSDEAAACELYRVLYPQVIAIVRGHLPRRLPEEDMVQEIFVKVFANLNRYNPAMPLENWVSHLALNTCVDCLRAEHRRPEIRWSDLGENEAAALESLLTTSPEEIGDCLPSLRELFAKLLETLSPADRMVITLQILEEKSVAEIASETGWSKALVKVRAFRARLRFRRALANLEKGMP